MTESWAHLINTALLGTDKQSLDVEALPEPVKKLVSQLDKKDKEAFFYKAAALTLQYNKAGMLPQKSAMPETGPCPAEELPYASPPAIGMLKKIVSVTNPKPALVGRWLDKCVEKKQLITPDVLVMMLDLGLDKNFTTEHEKIKAVVGKRGQWMRQFNNAWHYLQPPDYQHQWEEGNPVERIAALKHIRQTDPAQARTLLQKSWSQESTRHRPELLAILQMQLGTDDEPFLQQVFDEIQVVRQKKKDAQPDLLIQVRELLLSLPESQLSQEINKHIKLYIQNNAARNRPGLVAVTATQLVLPSEEDAFLNQANMEQWLGFIGEIPTQPNLTKTEAWFAQLLGYIHPDHWTELNMSTPEAVLPVITTHPAYQAEPGQYPLIAAQLAKAAGFHRSEQWARSWIYYLKDKIQENRLTALYAYLPDHELEACCQQYIRLTQSAEDLVTIRQVLLSRPAHQWSLAFTIYVVKELAEDMKSYNYGHMVSFLDQAIRYMHPGILQEDLMAYLPTDAQSWAKTQWERNVLSPLQDMLTLRLEIDKVFQAEK